MEECLGPLLEQVDVIREIHDIDGASARGARADLAEHHLTVSRRYHSMWVNPSRNPSARNTSRPIARPLESLGASMSRMTMVTGLIHSSCRAINGRGRYQEMLS